VVPDFGIPQNVPMERRLLWHTCYPQDVPNGTSCGLDFVVPQNVPMERRAAFRTIATGEMFLTEQNRRYQLFR